jgi:hypothetical protein
MIGQQWRAEHPKATVYGETRSESKHADLRAEGIEPVLRAQRAGHSCPNVVFCAAPSGIYINHLTVPGSDCCA